MAKYRGKARNWIRGLGIPTTQDSRQQVVPCAFVLLSGLALGLVLWFKRLSVR
jgi:hypothetical protein